MVVVAIILLVVGVVICVSTHVAGHMGWGPLGTCTGNGDNTGAGAGRAPVVGRTFCEKGAQMVIAR